MDETADVLLAYKMNGKDLAPDHGYPIRLIVPGYIGGRMVRRANGAMWRVGGRRGYNPSAACARALCFQFLGCFSETSCVLHAACRWFSVSNTSYRILRIYIRSIRYRQFARLKIAAFVVEIKYLNSMVVFL